MITMFKTTDQGLVQISEMADGSWINLVCPEPEELDSVARHFSIPPDFLTAPLDLDETARVEKEESSLLIVLRTPRHEGPQADIPFTTVPLGIVLTERVIVTIAKTDSGILDDMTAGRRKGISTTKRSRFFLQVFFGAAKRFLADLRAIDKQVDVLEDQLQQSLRNREVLELLKYQKSLTHFTTALKADQIMMNRLQRGGLFRMYPEDEELLDDVLTEIGQAIEMTAISSGILSQMMDAFASIISNNLNAVMKFLASATIVIALPSLLASVYGMNVDLPLGHHPLAFWLLLATAAAVTLAVVVVFYRKDWL
jgi:magnesium transporter